MDESLSILFTSLLVIYFVLSAIVWPIVTFLFVCSLYRQFKHNRRRREHNRQCDTLMPRITETALTCPHCDQTSDDFRLATRRWQWSQLICRRCYRIVELEDAVNQFPSY